MAPEINTQDFFTSLLELTGESGAPGMYNARRLAEQRNIAGRNNVLSTNRDYITDTPEAELIKIISAYLQSVGYATESDTNKMTFMGVGAGVSGMRFGTVIDTVNVNINANKRVTIYTHGTQEAANAIYEWADSIFTTKFRKVSIAKGIDRDGDLVVKTTNVAHSTQTRSTVPSFYPWLTCTPEEYFDEFMRSEEPVLIMFGPPGTGKSSFIRHLLEHTNGNALLAYNREVVGSPAVIDSFYDNNYDILVYEDLDDQLGKREDGNQLMPTILNGVDGVLKQNRRKKIVFSTNLNNADRIDNALKRMGRCFDIMYFGELSADQAAQVRIDLNLPVKDFSGKDKWSLAEITAKHSEVQQVINRFGRNSGF